MREGGVLVTIAGPPPEEAAREQGVRAELLVMSPSSERLARIAELVAAGDVRVEIAQVVPITEIQRAHELSESGHTREDHPDGRDVALPTNESRDSAQSR